MKRNKYVIANWKMNITKSPHKVIDGVSKHLLKTKKNSCKVVLCPPFTHLATLSTKYKNLDFGGQDCHQHNEGAFTGSVSAYMLKSIGCNYVIIGHSERRNYQKESNHELRMKLIVAEENKLKIVFCIGEKLNQLKIRDKILKKQLSALPSSFNTKNLIIAYEPVWAIGSGKTPSVDEIDRAHIKIRNILNQKYKRKSTNISILYGGSVNSKNSSNILGIKNVDGALVGGASLDKKEFCKIIDSSSR